MVADIATKALNSTRFEELKKALKMGKEKEDETMKEKEAARPPKVQEAIKEKEAVRSPKNERGEKTVHGEGPTIEMMKFVIAAAALSIAKGEGESEDAQEEGQFEFNMLVFLFTIAVVISTVLIQYLWFGGVRYVQARFGNQGAGASGSHHTATEGGVDTATEEEEDEVIIQDEVSPDSAPNTQTTDEETEGSLADRIEETIRNIEEEEADMWQEINRTRGLPDHFEPLQGENPFLVLTTRYGSVYHNTYQCNYLTAPRTGAARVSNWCHLCMNVAMRTRGRPPPGVTVWMHHTGTDFHTDRRCPRSMDSRTMNLCTFCNRAV